MKRTYLSLIFALVCVFGISAQTKVSILGDSYSTYGGYMHPEWNLCWYNGPDGGGDNKRNDVKAVEDTWWHQLIDDMGWQLEINNSYSGSTVSCSGYRKQDYSDRAFISRLNDLGNPDIIIVLSGTNDSWAGAPIGDYQYEGWTKADLYNFRPAFAYMLDRLSALYPDAKIVNVVNSELSEAVTQSQAEICDHYGVINIQLVDIDKQQGHPSIAGMKAISDQIKGKLAE